MNLDIKLRKPQALESCRISLAQDIAHVNFLKQYIFFKQWQDLHAYANEKGIQIVGDVPISHRMILLMYGYIKIYLI